MRRCSVMRMPLAAQRASILRVRIWSCPACATSSLSRPAASYHIERVAACVHRAIRQDRGAAPARRRLCRRRPDNNWAGATLRESRRGRKAGSPAALCSSTSRNTARAPSPRAGADAGRAACAASPRPRWRAATATERISASSATSRDMMKPASLPPVVARCAMTWRSSSRPSTSCSLQPRRNEAACSAAIAAASRLAASDKRRLAAREQIGEERRSSARQLRRRPAAARRARAGKAASAATPVSAAAAPSRATQSMSGARALLDRARRALAAPARPPPAYSPRCRRAAARRSPPRAAPRASGASRGATMRAPARAEHLQIDVIVARIDRRHHRQRVVGGDEGRGKGGERGEADRRLAGGERNAARRGDADAQAGEAAGPGGDGDAVEIGESRARRAPSRARSAASALRHGRAAIGSDSCATIAAAARCRARRPSRPRARYRWQGRAWCECSTACPASTRHAGDPRRRRL